MTRRRFAEHHTYAYRKTRAELLKGRPLCWRGCGREATSADHVPPLAAWYAQRTDPWQGDLRPSCRPCQYVDGGWGLANRLAQGAPPVVTRSRQWR